MLHTLSDPCVRICGGLRCSSYHAVENAVSPQPSVLTESFYIYLETTAAIWISVRGTVMDLLTLMKLCS